MRAYNFSSLLDEDGARIKNEIAEKNFQASGYFLFFAAEKYGIEFVFRNLLPVSIVHKTNSKLNPINWLKWIFNKIVWSEINANPKLGTDEVFSEAVRNFKSFTRVTQRIDLSEDKASLEALNCIIERILGEKERLYSLEASSRKLIRMVETHKISVPASVPTPVNNVLLAPMIPRNEVEAKKVDPKPEGLKGIAASCNTCAGEGAAQAALMKLVLGGRRFAIAGSSSDESSDDESSDDDSDSDQHSNAVSMNRPSH